MKTLRLESLIALLILYISCEKKEENYIANDLAYVGEFTIGLEGPAVDKQGTNLKELIRVRMGLITRVPHEIIHAPHKDSSEPHITGNYYLNETDGDTVIYNETTQSKEYTIKERVKPIQNSWHQFDGNHYHSSSAPVNNEKRIVLTYNFTTQEFK